MLRGFDELLYIRFQCTGHISSTSYLTGPLKRGTVAFWQGANSAQGLFEAISVQGFFERVSFKTDESSNTEISVILLPLFALALVCVNLDALCSFLSAPPLLPFLLKDNIGIVNQYDWFFWGERVWPRMNSACGWWFWETSGTFLLQRCWQ